MGVFAGLGLGSGLALNCVEGIEANHELLARRVAESVTIAEVAESLGILSRAEMNALLVPERLTQPVSLVS